MKPSRSVADLQQEVQDLRSQAMALKKTHNQLLQDANLARVRERKLHDELRRTQSQAAPERRGGKEQREMDELQQAMQAELDRLRKRNSTLQEQLRKFADSGGKKTPRIRRKTPRVRTDENVARPEDVEFMLDRIGEKLDHQAGDTRVDPAPPSKRTEQELADLRVRLRESQTKVLILEKQYEQIEAVMQAGRHVQQSAVEQVDRFKALLADANARHKHAQNRVQHLEFYQDQVESNKLIIDDLKATNANLQTQIDTLMQSAFLGDEAESNRLRAIEADHLAKLGDLRALVLQRDAELESCTEKLNHQSDRIRILESELKAAHDEHDRQVRESIKSHATIGDLQDRLGVFSTESGVDLDELDRALDLVRRQGKHASSGQASAPTIASLQRQKRDLEILNKDLVAEVKSKDDMIGLHSHLHAELDASYNRLQAEHNQLKKALLLAQKQAAMRPRAESVLSDLSLLSQASQVSFSGSNNVIAVRVVGATLSPSAPSFADGNDPLTFVTIDFFDFETCYSGVFGGFEPKYKLTAQFKIETDEYVVSYLRSGFMNIDLYRQTSHGGVEHVARCRVALVDLLSYSRRIRRSFPAVSVADPGQHVGTVEIVAKMYRPIVSPAASVADSGDEESPESLHTMQMSVTLLSVPLGDTLLSDMTLRVRNAYYDLDAEAERISSPEAPFVVFSFAFRSKHGRIMPHESIQMQLASANLFWTMDLSLAQISNGASGQYETDNVLNDGSGYEVGRSRVRADWSLIEPALPNSI